MLCLITLEKHVESVNLSFDQNPWFISLACRVEARLMLMDSALFFIRDNRLESTL